MLAKLYKNIDPVIFMKKKVIYDCQTRLSSILYFTVLFHCKNV